MNLGLDGRVALVSGCSQGLDMPVRTLARTWCRIYSRSGIGDDSALKKVEALERSYHSLTVSLRHPAAFMML